MMVEGSTSKHNSHATLVALTKKAKLKLTAGMESGLVRVATPLWKDSLEKLTLPGGGALCS